MEEVTAQIEPVDVSLNTAEIYTALQYLDGEELDMLDEWGIHLAELEKGLPNRLVVALGYFKLRRQHPDLTYEEGRKLVRVKLMNPTDEGVVASVDPTDAAD